MGIALDEITQFSLFGVRADHLFTGIHEDAIPVPIGGEHRIERRSVAMSAGVRFLTRLYSNRRIRGGNAIYDMHVHSSVPAKKEGTNAERDPRILPLTPRWGFDGHGSYYR